MDRETERLVREIEHYLVVRPLATDTVEGVARWWVLGEAPTTSLEAVQAALAVLVRRGVIEERCSSDGRSMFAARQ